MTAESGSPKWATKLRVRLVHYTYTQQNHKCAAAMTDVFGEPGGEVTQATIEFSDQRYLENFSRSPMPKHSSAF